MKPFLFLIFFSTSFCNNAFTQEANKILKNEWGVNASYFLQEFIFQKEVESIIDYSTNMESLLTFRCFYNSKNAWQIGTNFYVKKSTEDFAIGFGGDQSEKKKGYFLRLGYQHYWPLSEKSTFFFGSDILFGLQKYTAVIDFDAQSNFFQEDFLTVIEEKEIGLIPHLGFRFQANTRISFSIETSLIGSYLFLESKEDNLIINNPNDTFRADSEKLNIKFQQPLSLFFNLRF